MQKTLLATLLVMVVLAALPCEAKKLKAVRETVVGTKKLSLYTACRLQVKNQPKLIQKLFRGGDICQMPKGTVVEMFGRGKKNYYYAEWCQQSVIRVKGTAECFSHGKIVQKTGIFWVFDNDFE